MVLDLLAYLLQCHSLIHDGHSGDPLDRQQEQFTPFDMNECYYNTFIYKLQYLVEKHTDDTRQNLYEKNKNKESNDNV